ncbi:hypothetical protein [Zunongwangia pacifica]|uniref:Uncharacterized protein n=1 Tax=Zunongwangia pacifica TaxID=2911062 RepID=A0A9X2CP69_9FLAO|nr:hypothetical protein [Zunongwangia pacifica]MCL6217697.1 hypothetical protein [Zunongwangia pacifica]
MITKIFNLELIAPIDFKNPFVIENTLKEKMLNHLEKYTIKAINLSLNRRDNYVLIAIVEMYP